MMDDLPDELLLQILHYLTPHDLKNISLLNARYARLVEEKSLWNHIDGRTRNSGALDVIYFNEHVHEATTAYMIRTNYDIVICPQRIQKWRNYNNLSVLVLDGTGFERDSVMLKDFPTSLIELSLNRCDFKDDKQFFQHSASQFKSLRVITLEHCLSIGESIMISLARFARLEIVSLNGCMSIAYALVPLTLGMQHGFKNLKVLDVRCTGLGDEVLNLAAHYMPQLGELYFHCYFNYIKEHAREKGIDDFERLLQMKELDRQSHEQWLEAYKNLEVHNYKSKFTNIGVGKYGGVAFHDEGYVPPESILYKRPYSECTCSMSARQEDRNECKLDAPSTSSSSTASPSTSSSASRKRQRSPSPSAPDADGDAAQLTGPNPLSSKQHRLDSPDNLTVIFTPYFALEGGDSFHKFPLYVPPRRLISVDHEQVMVINFNSDQIRQQYHRVGFGEVIRPVELCINVPGRRGVLNKLSLRGSRKITDHVLPILKQLDLELLDVTGTSVTAKGVKSFQKLMPMCRVVHESTCTCRPRPHN